MIDVEIQEVKLPERRWIPMVLNKKALKLVVCMSLIVALAISALGLSAGATYENTHYNSGDQASDIVGVATTQVGYSEGYDGYTKYGDWYGLPNSDWCAMFVSWCANQAGVDTSTFPSFALCSAGCDWFMSQGRFQYSGSYIPQAGDLIFYASYGNIYHVGLVTGSDGYNVYSIEGNYNEAVCNVSYSLSYGDILGYATPAYNTSSNGTPNNNIPDYNDSEDDVYVEDSDSEESTDEYEEVTDSEESTDEYEETTDSEESTDEYAEDTDSEEYTEENTDEVTDTDSEETAETDTESEVAYEVGDINGDGRVNTIDAILIQRYLALQTEFDDAQLKRADVDGSGSIDVADVITMLELLAGLRV